MTRTKELNLKLIENAMLTKGLTVEALAVRAKITYWKAYRTTKGETAHPPVVVRICKALDLDPETIWIERAA